MLRQAGRAEDAGRRKEEQGLKADGYRSATIGT